MIRLRATAAVLLLSIGVAACSSDSKSAATTSAAAATVAATDAPATTGVTDTSTVEDVVEIPATEPTTAATDAPTTEATEVATTQAATTTEAPTTTAAPKVLEVLVTNDDGYDAPGIDAVVEYLRTRPDVHVSVWAPLTNQSGAGDKSTPGGATNITDVMTKSGYPAKAVEGFPADSVNAAFASGYQPDLVVSGSNLGQNYGPLTVISGTVGAAATAARQGIFAVAISQGFPADGVDFDFPSSVAVLSAFLDAHIADYANGSGALLTSINVPTCPVGVAPLPTVSDVPLATGDNGRQLGAPTACDGNPATPADDIDAFDAGHPTIVELDVQTLGQAA
ncbi:MAG: putative acid phosphatase [Acidimicrobiales bacterium]|nr:putative acid phosphatase [Acidimicrobiales bacterium]